MIRLGYSMLAAGFLAGAYATALDVEAVNWAMFFPAAVIAALGLVVVKRSLRDAAQAEEVLSANRDILESSLDRVIQEVDAISAARRDSAGTRQAITTDGLREEIDDRLRDDFRRFVDVRQSLVYLYGVQAYADVMSDFAAGERHINRAWSASADGYGGEADRYLERAAASLRSARQQLQGFVNAR